MNYSEVFNNKNMLIYNLIFNSSPVALIQSASEWLRAARGDFFCAICLIIPGGSDAARSACLGAARGDFFVQYV